MFKQGLDFHFEISGIRDKRGRNNESQLYSTVPVIVGENHNPSCESQLTDSDSMTRRPLRKTLTSGLGLDDMSLAWPAVVQLLVFIYSGIQ